MFLLNYGWERDNIVAVAADVGATIRIFMLQES
jgi:hypothetical protein